MRLKLTFDSFQLESSSTCEYDYVEVRDGSSLQGKFCGKTVPSAKIAESGTMQVTFVSDGSVSHSGFLASYSAVPLGNEGKTVFTFSYGKGCWTRKLVVSALAKLGN